MSDKILILRMVLNGEKWFAVLKPLGGVFHVAE